MNCLITVCARGGSKGLPKKNIKPLLGRPLIRYTLDQARAFQAEWSASHPEDVVGIVISTDDPLIYEFATEEIALIERASHLAEDASPKVAVLKDALMQMESRLATQWDYLIDLDVTSPLRTVGDIKGVLERVLNDNQIGLGFSVVPARRNPYFNLVEVSSVTGVATKSKDSNFPNRQSAPPCYDMNASIYAYRRQALLNLAVSPLEGVCGIYEMPETYVIDIDHPEDFEVMACLASNGFFDWVPEIYSARQTYQK